MEKVELVFQVFFMTSVCVMTYYYYLCLGSVAATI